MKPILVAALLALAPIAFPALADATDQFDLVCRGEMQSAGEAPVAETRRYRIDLAARLWCKDECPAGRAIQDFDPSLITLARSLSDGTRSTHLISRINGFYQDAVENRALQILIVHKGACDVAPFSGFPKGKF